MIVERVITINRLEPQPCSLRVPAGMDTKLDLYFKRQDGSPYPIDVDAQLSLTTRSDNVTSYFSFAATDIVNGKARATIPASSLQDPNGARLRIAGTVDGEAVLLATGTLIPIDFAGVMEQPPDVIDSVPLSLSRATTTNTAFTIKLWDDAGKTDPYDLSTATIAAKVVSTDRTALLATFAVVQTDVNVVQISLTPAQVAALPDSCWWLLTIGSGGGSTTLCQGPVTVTGTQLLPLGYLLQWSGGMTSATSSLLTTASFTPPNASLLVVVASSLVPNGRTAPAVISNTGTALTWTKQKEQIVTNSGSAWQANVEIWTAPVGTAAAMTVQIQFNQTATDPGGYYQVRVLSFTGYDSVSPVAQVYGTGGTAGRTGAFTATWPTAPNVNNYIVTASADNDSGSAATGNLAPGPDFTQIDVVAASAGFFQTLSQYRTNSTSTTVSMNNFTTVGAFAWSIAGIEIRAQLQVP